MGAVAHLPNQFESAQPAADASLAELLSTSSDIIESIFADRMRQLGSTEADIHKLSTSAAYAVFAWSAGRGFGA
ncbi:hypothetical protein FZI85_12080 [Mycobacterium sp. CBMA293]|uniref:hypothetical protein n=1 Tax=unclassified Mycolicibacterium TaxID=2636767 RepID=UPI0012DD16D7|nr:MULTISPECIES: hypothetical protein [unclassified Mycolicibacterium]MUL47879.1 hypothetical protein [Mycolicibacterium sp. CBMA 360]MUL59273.1 hypothetical protein [Mycolicibacterium sp. CBMA 335]MUL70998.1 hypothetical protein [Mycolicibacterium sp. CBMA 311]MUL94641.1 hypothetical protein [Mycolicibacterium sp. CBMA 230]MUM11761.1 hypothetical protein [Mycolicibacterium sp. CBMA 293]